MISSLIILIKMIAAHLVGDFIVQSDKLCSAKCSNKTFDKYTALSLHATIQAVVTYLFICEWDNWIVPCSIAISHFGIDWLKSKSKNMGLRTFLIDQLAHYIIMVALWWIYYIKLNPMVDITHYIISFKAWVIFTSFIAVTKPSSILIRLFLESEKWTPDSEYYQGLPNAGRWIGYIERFLILIFIFTSNIEGVGFLLAAKSIFRFGELNKAKDLKITEYVLIGTLMSFAIAIAIAYSALFILGLVYE